MSLDGIPVCASCGTSSEMSISCTECFQISCAGCFSGLVSAALNSNVHMALLAARICRKCIASATEAESALGGVPEEHCPKHGRKRTLYCLNCSEIICGGCIDIGEPHDVHRVDNLAAMYLEKASKLDVKLNRAEQQNDERNAGSAVCRRNLELIEQEEESGVKEIEALAEASKSKLCRLTAVRKKALKAKLKVPAKNSAALKGLRNKCKQLSPYELLGQLPECEEQCDGLLAQENDIQLQKVEDIHCELIPQYQFAEVVFRGFRTAANDARCVAHLHTPFDIVWEFAVQKASDMLLIKPSTNDPEILKLRHMLLVVIPHLDYTKTVYQPHELQGQNCAIEVVQASQLVEQGFCGNVGGDLVMRIGIRCFNALIEKQILHYRYYKTRNYITTYFHRKLSDLQNGTTLKSWQMLDDDNRSWGLHVALQSGYLGLSIELRRGFRVRTDFFIELQHSDPMKTIVKRCKCTFDTRENKGWPEFVKWDELTSDRGFYPNGSLRIHFGVRPSTGSAKGSLKSAVNA